MQDDREDDSTLNRLLWMVKVWGMEKMDSTLNHMLWKVKGWGPGKDGCHLKSPALKGKREEEDEFVLNTVSPGIL